MQRKLTNAFSSLVMQDNFAVSTMGFAGIIENTFGSELKITNCLFEDNQYGDTNNPAVSIAGSKGMNLSFRHKMKY